MKQFEKLDLLLKLLYDNRNEGYYPLTEICQRYGVATQMEPDLKQISKKLQNAGMIDTLFAADECFALLTHQGIAFCLTDSYSHKGKPVIDRLMA